MSGVDFLRGSLWTSQPPGIAIIATHEHVTVESGGQILIGLKMHRPEAHVLLDHAVVLVGGREQHMTPTSAREWAALATLETQRGGIAIGAPLTEAWDAHVERWSAARARPLSQSICAPSVGEQKTPGGILDRAARAGPVTILAGTLEAGDVIELGPHRITRG